jgi:hypothetical protein
MTADDTHAIAWRYAEPYSFYDWDRDPGDLAELLDPSEWGRRYFSADDADGELAGFFVIKAIGRSPSPIDRRPARPHLLAPAKGPGRVGARHAVAVRCGACDECVTSWVLMAACIRAISRSPT